MKPYFEDDRVTLYHGDALALLSEMPPFDALVTDPPYSSGGQFRSDRMRSTVEKYVNSDTVAVRPEFSGDNRDQRGFFAWSTLWLSFAAQSAKAGSHALLFTDWRQLPTVTDAVQAGGWIWRGIGTWHKPGIRMQRGGVQPERRVRRLVDARNLVARERLRAAERYQVRARWRRRQASHSREAGRRPELAR